MTVPNPARVLNHSRAGHICDACNRTVRTGDLVRGYATYGEREGWLLRRLWCEECGSTTIVRGTDGADEVVLEAVFWAHRLVGVRVVDRSRAQENSSQ